MVGCVNSRKRIMRRFGHFIVRRLAKHMFPEGIYTPSRTGSIALCRSLSVSRRMCRIWVLVTPFHINLKAGNYEIFANQSNVLGP